MCRGFVVGPREVLFREETKVRRGAVTKDNKGTFAGCRGDATVLLRVESS